MMKINILYFGMIAEWKGKTTEVRELSIDATLNELKNRILSEIPELQRINFSLAVNQKMETSNPIICEGDELAFFPPFAGG